MTAPRSPDFLVVGTMKSGTSTLADYLRDHPKLWLPYKELHYFDIERNYERGPDWYAARLLQECPNPTEPGLLLGEKTPTYSYKPEAAERIFKLVPGVRLIWIFRNPTQRAYSNYLHRLKQGQDVASFTRAVYDERRRMLKDPYLGYVERSKYIKQVRHFLERFPREQMHFLLFEHLVSEPARELRRVTDFLDVQPLTAEPIKKRSNKTVVPRYTIPMWLSQKLLGPKNSLYWRIRMLGEALPQPAPPIERPVAEYLREHFRPYNQQLAELTGLDTSVWDVTKG